MNWVSWRIRSLIAALMASCTLIASLVLPCPAHADLLTLEMRLTSVAPEVITTEGDLVITGEVTNPTSETIIATSVNLWRDATPIQSVGRLAELVGNPGIAGEAMVSGTAQQELGDIAPGETVSFTVSASLSGLSDELLYLTTPGSVYQVGAVASGTTANHSSTARGAARGFVINAGDTKVATTELILLSHRPTALVLDAINEEPELTGGALLHALENDLGDLLTYASANHSMIALDPALYDEVTILAGRGSPVAKEWMATLVQAIDAGQVVRTLYGNPDLASAIQIDGQAVLQAAMAALPQTHPLADLPLMVVGYQGYLSQEMVDLLDQAHPEWVLGGASTGSYLIGQNHELKVLVVTSHLNTSAPSAADVENSQLWMAQQFLTGVQGGVALSLVTTPDELAAATPQVSWRSSQPLGDLLDQPVQGFFPTDEPATVDLGTFAEVWGEVHQSTEVWVDLSSEDLGTAVDRFTATAWSSAFRRDRTVQALWATQATSGITQTTNGSRLHLSISNWVTTAEENNYLPATITNDTGRSIRVRVHFVSDNELRISVGDSEVVTVEPGESLTIRVTPRTNGNGKVGITAYLQTEGGYQVAPPVRFVITGTEAGKVAWLLIIGSAVILLTGTAWRVRSMHRERVSAQDSE